VGAPSANRYGRVSPTTARHVAEDLSDSIDYLIDGGKTSIGVESTVVDLTCHPPRILRPGGLSAEEIRKITKDLVICPFAENGKPRSPGQFRKHYSPKTKTMLFEKDSVVFAAERVKRLLAEGRKVGILVPEKYLKHFKHDKLEVEHLSNDAHKAARQYYSRLRKLDRIGLDVICLIDEWKDGLGLAISDRMIKAAGGRYEK
jgi:L-threonylcarbamoyladenylate synthase